MSVDGYIDDMSPERLQLSNASDLDRVDATRAGCDAILVGANTVRQDNPELLVKSESRRVKRVQRGWPPDLTKVTLTNSGDIDPSARFFTTGDAPKLVYCASSAVTDLMGRLDGQGEVIDAGDPVVLHALLADLASRGIRRLMVEGGGEILTRFLTAGLADELQLAVAPFFIGDPAAPRFVRPGVFPQSPVRPMRLGESSRIGEVALLRYFIGDNRG